MNTEKLVTKSFRGARALLAMATTVVLGVALAVLGPASLAGASTMVSNVTVSIAPPSTAAKATTVYDVGFKTSSTGSLNSTSGLINIILPSATGLGTLVGLTGVYVSGNQVGQCYNNSTTSPPVTQAQCDIFGGDTIAASTAVTVTLNGVVNPSAGGYTLQVNTTSDTTSVTSPSYTVTAAKSVSATSVSLTSYAAAKKKVTYAVGFTTSATGALSGDAGSLININVPNGTKINKLTSGTGVFVSGNQVGDCYENTTTQVQCDIFGGDTIAASTAVTVTLAGVKNPAAGSYQLGIQTSSDVTSVDSPSYTIVPPPTITKLKPGSGPIGQTVTITGTNLLGATKVGFNGVSATITSDTATKIVTKVPNSASTGKVTVTTPGGTATSPSVFTVT